MISLRTLLSALFLCALMAHVTAYWGGGGFYGQRHPRFRSNYYSPSMGYGMSNYSPWGQASAYGRGYGGGFWDSRDDYLDDLQDRNHYGRGWM